MSRAIWPQQPHHILDYLDRETAVALVVLDEYNPNWPELLEACRKVTVLLESNNVGQANMARMAAMDYSTSGRAV